MHLLKQTSIPLTHIKLHILSYSLLPHLSWHIAWRICCPFRPFLWAFPLVLSWVFRRSGVDRMTCDNDIQRDEKSFYQAGWEGKARRWGISTTALLSIPAGSFLAQKLLRPSLSRPGSKGEAVLFQFPPPSLSSYVIYYSFPFSHILRCSSSTVSSPFRQTVFFFKQSGGKKCW